MHVETSFTVLVHAPAAQTAKLFTPEGERVWAGRHWDPQYVYPAGPARDAVGAVFTIQHGPVQAVWTVVRRDDVARQYEYVYFIPEIMITTITVHFEPMNVNTTQVQVKYRRTALSSGGEAHVKAMSNDDKNAGAAWEAAIEKYLATQGAAAR